ncbi:hypothetical protein [Novipirellula caenicola]|uniref:DUF304 domain-containing protein n=1 Tax=Novipirellula caenicola TaxID=1536901 RepID=A0ABP9VMB9_9BACT
MSGTSKITWWVPRWAFVPQLWQSLRSCLLNRHAITNIFIGTFVSCAVIIGGLKIALPALVIPNLWTVFAALPMILVLLACQFGLLAAIPPNVTLRPDRLQKTHGQTGLVIKADQFVATQLYVHREDRIRLKVRYRQRDRLRTLVLGVPSSIDLDQLVALLPISPKIRDARARSISVENGTPPVLEWEAKRHREQATRVEVSQLTRRNRMSPAPQRSHLQLGEFRY